MARNGLTKVIYKGTFVSKQSLSRMTLGKTVNSTFWVLLLFVRRVHHPAQPASLPAWLPKLSLPCRAKRGNPHSNAYPNSCVQIKEAWHCCFGAGRAGPHRQWDNKVKLQPSALQANGVVSASLRAILEKLTSGLRKLCTDPSEVLPLPSCSCSE